MHHMAGPHTLTLEVSTFIHTSCGPMLGVRIYNYFEMWYNVKFILQTL